MGHIKPSFCVEGERLLAARYVLGQHDRPAGHLEPGLGLPEAEVRIPVRHDRLRCRPRGGDLQLQARSGEVSWPV